MTTLTINVADDVEKQFRKHAAALYNGKKGFLGDAITEAMRNWLKEHTQQELAKQGLTLLKKGFPLGKILYKKRDELHDH